MQARWVCVARIVVGLLATPYVGYLLSSAASSILAYHNLYEAFEPGSPNATIVGGVINLFAFLVGGVIAARRFLLPALVLAVLLQVGWLSHLADWSRTTFLSQLAAGWAEAAIYILSAVLGAVAGMRLARLLPLAPRHIAT